MLVSELNDGVRLRGWEQLAHRVGSVANRTELGQRLQFLLLRGLAYRLAFEILGRRILVEGLDELSSLKPESGVIIVSNHRTIFDLFAILLAMVHRDRGGTQTFSFPVRSRFFYDSPVGTLVNLGLGGGARFPPIFRDAGKAAYNNAAIDYLTASLRRPGHVVGIHPEGTRSLEIFLPYFKSKVTPGKLLRHQPYFCYFIRHKIPQFQRRIAPMPGLIRADRDMTINSEYFFRFFVILIKSEFILHPKEQQTSGSQADSETGEIDQAESLILKQVSDSYF